MPVSDPSPTDRQSLYVIDGFAQIFRAYYALRGGLTSPVTGEPTGAVFGFCAMLIKLLSQYQPDYLVVAYDSEGLGFRGEIFPEYKATRRPTPEDLVPQIARVRELIEAFGIPVLAAPGFEADDVIATLAAHVADHEQIELRIVSRDKDLEQLLTERVVMVDVQQDTVLDPAGLLASKGVRPDQVIDLQTLTGDSTDNVPGVPGIGPKTAAQLLAEYDTLANLMAHADEIRGKRGENLRAAADLLDLSRQLVTLRRDVPLALDLETWRVRPPRTQVLLPLFEQLGFNRFRGEVQDIVAQLAASAPAAAADEPAPAAVAEPDWVTAAAGSGQYTTLRTRAEVEAALAAMRAAPYVAIDTETTGLGADSLLVGLCLAWAPGQGAYLPLRSPEPATHLGEAEALALLREWLEDPAAPKVGHNVKFDAAVLRRAWPEGGGIGLRGVICDTMLAATLLEASASVKLDALAEQYLGRAMIPISDVIEAKAEATLFDEEDSDKPARMDEVPLAQATAYAAEDAEVTWALAEQLLPALEASGQAELSAEVEAPLTCVLAEMEHAGILCDAAVLRRQGVELSARVAELRDQIFAIVGHEFTIDSTKQLGAVLFDELGLEPGRRTKTGRSTDISVLEKLAATQDVNEPHTMVPGLVIEYRQLTKLISTYLGTLAEAADPADGRIRTHFHQLVTATGRLASSGPNLQNIPVRTDIGRQIRRAFVAPPGGVLFAADYSQVELRLLAHLSGDENLQAAFHEGADIHTWVAARVFGVPAEQVDRGQRGHAKTINFGIIYGVTPFGLARRIPGLDNEGAMQLINDYKLRFPGIASFLAECVRHAQAYGYVATVMGRRRHIPEIHSSNGNTRSLGERLAINTVVQGSAADLIKLAMVRLQTRIEREQLPLRLLLQIHDELILEGPAERAAELAAVISAEMEGAMQLSVPLEAECGWGADWLEAK